ncbi:MAG TPA: SgcJ/EcaC family oxidoreductase [Methylomirabilota bacterium]|nr:SgcJ/EcaC family oxidoreductase [Methylomirabilota bacterium]
MATISDHPQGTGSEEETVKAVMAATTEAFNKHDATAWTRFCLPGARLVTVRGESMQGVAEIEKGLAAIFHGRGRNAALRTLAVAVTFIRPDVALAHVTNEMSGVAAPDGQLQPPHRELSIRVLVKDGGGWRIAAFQNTICPS